jgi:hypothetical protein
VDQLRLLLHVPAIATALALAACDHTEPFTTPVTSVDTTRLPGNPARLTYSIADDRTAAWLPDGSGFVYSTERVDRADHDRCLAVIPTTGGRIRQMHCESTVRSDTATDVYEWPAVSPEGRAAWYKATSRVGRVKESTGWLMLGRLGAPAESRIGLPMPYLSGTGRFHMRIGHVQWLSDTRLAWVGQRVFWEGSTFFPDTFVTGLDVVVADLDGDTPVLRTVPGSDWASSVSAGETPDVVYYTLGGDPNVYRHDLASGSRTVAWSSGGEIVREAQVRAGRLVAVVGRSVLFRFEEIQSQSWVQRDEGGDLVIVDLVSGAVQRIAREGELFRRPVLSPDGERVVVEVSPFAEPRTEVSSGFNAPNHRPDLWLYQLP